MDLKSIFLQSYYSPTTTEKSSGTNLGSSYSFDSFLSIASNNVKKDSAANKSTDFYKNNNNIQDNRKIVNSNEEEKVTDDVVNEKEVKTENKQENKKTEKKQTDTNDKKEVSDIKDKVQKVIEKISDELGVSVEQIQNVLQQLNINIQDLTEPNNLLSFMQKLMNVDNSLDLLSIEGIKNMFETVKNAVEDLVKFQKNITVENSNIQTEELVAADDISKSIAGAVNEENFVSAEEDIKTDIHTENNTVSTQTTAINTENNTLFMGQMHQQNNPQQNMANNNFNQNNDFISGIQNNTQKEIFKAFTEVINRTQANKNVDTAEIIKQIVERLKTDFTSEVTQIKVTLKPEYLGDISLKIASQDGVITAQFTAQNQRVKEIIEANFNQLKDTLNEQGIEVSQISVNIGNEESGNSEQSNFEQRKSSTRINDIINNSIKDVNFGETEEIKYVDEGQVLSANVNYTA